MATGQKGLVKVGHKLKSCTKEISVIRLSSRGVVDADICFVDTPGFDDSDLERSDLDVLKMISDFLNKTYVIVGPVFPPPYSLNVSYKKKIRLTGLLYFHRISDPRMTGTALMNLRLFEELCGEHFGTVVLTTTMWDQEDENEGTKREEQLQGEHWRKMIERGSSIKRFLRTPQSAFEIMTPIFDKANARTALLLQEEMNDLGLQLKETSAGKALFLELEGLVSRRQKSLEKIRTPLQDQRKPEQPLLTEFAMADSELKRVLGDLQELQITSPVDIRKAARGINWILGSSEFIYVISYSVVSSLFPDFFRSRRRRPL